MQNEPRVPQTTGDTRDHVIKGHKYDGIKEYDNPMPGWWVWLFVATFVFSVFYYVGITFFDFVDTYEDDLAQSMEELQLIRETYAASGQAFEPDEASLAALADDPDRVQAGAEIFATYCLACHGPQGQGLIGPNLTDEYWLHDDDLVSIFEIVTNGVPEKGMTPWGDVLTPEQRGEVTAFVNTLRGTDPPNPKEPQGERVEMD